MPNALIEEWAKQIHKAVRDSETDVAVFLGWQDVPPHLVPVANGDGRQSAAMRKALDLCTAGRWYYVGTYRVTSTRETLQHGATQPAISDDLEVAIEEWTRLRRAQGYMGTRNRTPSGVEA